MRTVMTGFYRVGEGRFARFASGFALLFGLAWAFPDQAAEAGKKPAPGADIFEGTNILRIKISIPESGLRILRSYSWGNGGQKAEVKATLSEGTNVYKNVAVHLKGSAGSFQSIDERPALTLNFDKFTQGQTFHGLSKISLNNSVQDPTFVEEKICREMYEAAGVPAPRADYALLTLNGTDLGLYVLVEGYNKQFLKRYFKNVTGNLYDGGFCREITDDLTVNSGEKPNDKSDLQRLASEAARARQTRSLKELSKVLDIDRFLTMVALEVIQCHWDGYTMNRNNYRVYHDMDQNKMIFMPHGMDQMFGGGGRSSPDSSIFPPLQGFVSSAVLGTPEGRKRYLEKLAEVRTNVFREVELTNRVYQIAQRIAPYASGNPGRYGRRYYRGGMGVGWLCQSIMDRARSLDEQLNQPRNPAAFTDGILRVTEWSPFNGNPNLDFATSKDGKKLLHIGGDGGLPSASWRTRVLLPMGQYRLEGYARTRGAGIGASGAHLRISGATPMPVLHGDAEWTMLSYTFAVDDATREVTLVCELKGNKGEAWFDTSSLKVRKIE
jgi:spore coat protein H